MTMPERIKQGHPHLFPCGHRRELSNMTKEEHPCCIACKRLRYLAGKTAYKCGHPVTEENTRYHGVHNKYRRCRTCDNERQLLVNQRVRRMARIADTPRKPVPITQPVLVCRMERAKRSERPDNAMQEAQAAYRERLAREQEDRKGGRPRKDKPQIHAHRSVELADLLPNFYGRAS